MTLISSGLFWAILGTNSLIVFCVYKDLKEVYEQKKRDEQRKKNLLSDTIDISLTIEEETILENLSRGDSKKYLREQIKELCKN